MIRHPIERIEVRVQVGTSLLAATDDPLFLGLRGPEGREFCLAPARGHAFRRGASDRFVFAAPDAPDTNVSHPELNDPTHPPLALEAIGGVYLRKGLAPIPNVRGLGELDDRIEIVSIEVDLSARDREGPLRFAREGPLWLGLVCGLLFEVPRVGGGGGDGD